MSICDSSSSTTITDSTNSSNTSLTTGFISIPNTDSSLDDFSLQQRRPEKLRQHYRGQLRLDVNIIGNYLFTHIIAARNLGAKQKSKPSSFVEITIIPESRVHSKCMSTIYRSSHRPVFDEKVSMELPINFKSKRLLVTVYHDRQFNKNHQILGCMSFGLHRISTGSSCQLACGWFYLLDEDIGKRRHVKVINNAVNVKSYSSSSNVSKLLLCRSLDGGFGFSVIGSCPVRICRVKKGSTAEMHNLQQDDAIIMIDSRDVSRCTSMEVSSIIRSTKHFMTVAIQRGPHYTCDKNEDKVKNGMVAKLIKKIFFSGNQHKTSVTTTTTSSSDILVDYGWLENDRQHSRERPPVPLNGARDFRKVFQQSVQKDSNSRGWPHLTSKDKKNVAIGRRGIRLARQDGIESDPGTPDQRWHSEREMNGRGHDDDDDDDDSDGSDYDDLQSSNLGRMSKMLSPVAECDSHLQTDSQFLGCHDDTYKDDGQDDSQNNASLGAVAPINNEELLHDESIYNDNNKNVNRSLMNDNRLMTDDYDENGYLDDNDSNYDEGNLDPRELSQGGSCRSYLDENQDLDQKENLFQNGLLSTKSRRTSYTSHSRLSFRRNHPLTSRENFSPNFQETPDSLKNREVNDDSDAFSSILGTPSAPQKSRKGKAVVSKIKTIFKNRHAS